MKIKKEVLISFLNAVLLLTNNNIIIDVDILTPYQLPDLKGGKVTIVDVKAKDQNGKTNIVEMKVAEVDGFDKRVLYYASKSYVAQIERGDQYENLNSTYFIGILDFEVTRNPNFISRHKIFDCETNENYLKDIEFNFIELSKFNKNENELESIVDQWVYFLKNAENLNVIPENLKDEGLEHAYQDADKHNWTKAELEAYDYVLMREQDDRGRLSFAIKKEKEQNKIEFAKKLLKRNVLIEHIAEDTELSIAQIEKLRNEK